jgi:hypothetical protein
MRRLYGASPLHLLAHAALLPLCAWGLIQVLSVSSPKAAQGIVLWLVGAVVLHDLVLLPLYSAADRAGRLALRGPDVNFLRVPAGLSLLLLAVFWGTIGGRGEHAYHAVSGRSYDGYALRWLLVTAVLFAGSALLYLARRRSGRPRRRDR